MGDWDGCAERYTITLLHSERPKLYNFGLSECKGLK